MATPIKSKMVTVTVMEYKNDEVGRIVVTDGVDEDSAAAAEVIVSASIGPHDQLQPLEVVPAMYMTVSLRMGAGTMEVTYEALELAT